MDMRILFVSFLSSVAIVFPGAAMAQSACPQGTVAGSQTCGPDDPVINYRVDRYEGYGAYVKSTSSSRLYWVKGADAGGLAGVTAEAMDVCRRAGHSDCEVLGTWRNSCASVGSVMVDGVKRVIFKTGSNSRVARRAVRQECSAIAPSAECKVNKPECVFFRTDLVPY